jgi:hypothetical protein
VGVVLPPMDESMVPTLNCLAPQQPDGQSASIVDRLPEPYHSGVDRVACRGATLSLLGATDLHFSQSWANASVQEV